MTNSKNKTSYRALRDELDAVLLKLESDDITIDEAIPLHKNALELINKLDAYLKDAEGTIVDRTADN